MKKSVNALILGNSLLRVTEYKRAVEFQHYPPKPKKKNATQIPLPHSDIWQFQARVRAEYPTDIAATFSRQKVQELSLQHPHQFRKIFRRHFRRSRNVFQGVHQRKHTRGKKRKPRYSYAEYIHSKEWSRRKNQFYQLYGRKCAACGTSTLIHLHHMKYSAYNGMEPDGHLIALCQHHHDDYHKSFGTKRTMIKTTLLYVERIKAELA